MEFIDPFAEYLITGIYRFDECSSNYTKQQKLQTTIPSNIVRAVQAELSRLGYTEVGYIDGLIGPKTIAALRRYQHDRHIGLAKYCI